MQERPILFSAPMIRAILSGSKSQTRRVLQPAPTRCNGNVYLWQPRNSKTTYWLTPGVDLAAKERCPYGQPGDRLYVKEAWGVTVSKQGDFDVVYRADFPGGERQSFRDYALKYERLWRGLYGSDGKPLENPFSETDEPHWRSSLFLPRVFSRLVLEIDSVRVERLQDITKEDAIAEGIERDDQEWAQNLHREIAAFRQLWDSINGKTFSWQSNPFVWRLEFRRLEADR